MDDTEERISELFFLAAITGMDSLWFLGRYPGRRYHGACGREGFDRFLLRQPWG